MIGIYKITNNINGKSYIGQSKNVSRRLSEHKNRPFYSGPSSYSSPLYCDIREYGLENFVFEVVEECLPKELNEREQYYIELFQTYYTGYNLTKGGSSGFCGVALTEQQAVEIQQLLKHTYVGQDDIAEAYNISQPTVSGINRGLYWRDNDLDYPLRNRQETFFFTRGENKKNIESLCVDCGVKINRASVRCVVCSNIARRQVERPSKDVLEQNLIEAGSLSAIGQKYGVTGNTVKKWCSYYDIERETRKTKEKPSKPLYKPIQQICLKTGEVVNTFTSVAEAGRAIGAPGSYHMSSVASGKRKSAYGFSWRFIED